MSAPHTAARSAPTIPPKKRSGTSTERCQTATPIMTHTNTLMDAGRKGRQLVRTPTWTADCGVQSTDAMGVTVYLHCRGSHRPTVRPLGHGGGVDPRRRAQVRHADGCYCRWELVRAAASMGFHANPPNEHLARQSAAIGERRRERSMAQPWRTEPLSDRSRADLTHRAGVTRRARHRRSDRGCSVRVLASARLDVRD